MIQVHGSDLGSIDSISTSLFLFPRKANSKYILNTNSMSGPVLSELHTLIQLLSTTTLCCRFHS